MAEQGDQEVYMLESKVNELEEKIEDLELQIKIYKASLARYDELINAFNLEAVFEENEMDNL